MISCSGPPSRGPTLPFECNPASDAAPPPRVQRTRTLSDISGTNKHDQRRLDLDRGMVWREQPLEQWFQGCLPGADPTGVSFPPFTVELENQEQAMYAGLVCPWALQIGSGRTLTLRTARWSEQLPKCCWLGWIRSPDHRPLPRLVAFRLIRRCASS